MNMTDEKLQSILEAAIMAAGRPLTPGMMQKLFDEGEEPEISAIKKALTAIQSTYQTSGIELKEVASGYQFQAKSEFAHWLSRLWEERAPRYSRAFLETLALVAYRQPVTRAEIEDIRGVSASSHILKALQEREWIRILGYKEVPGKPALYGTTKVFLDYFNLKSLDELPTLAELKDLATQEAKLQVEIDFENGKTGLSTKNDEMEPSETSLTNDENETSSVNDQTEFSEPDNETPLTNDENETSCDQTECLESDTEIMMEMTLIETNDENITIESIPQAAEDTSEFKASDKEPTPTE
jgi:segregation and condensation protein B